MSLSVRSSNRLGFTLTEILIVVFILGVVAALAIPNYNRTIEVQRSTEAQAALQLIHAGEKIYELNNGSYWTPGANPPIGDINTNLNLDLALAYYTIDLIDNNAGAGFRARADRNGSSNKTFTITEDYPNTPIAEAGSY